ncbi:MAG: DNA repair protein RadC [Lachnospiraceae bacterium]|nr:DNA repair protein RadC [Lachnospiraceae bacterium]
MKMKNLPVSERPYEKFFERGVSSMSDAELLAVIIKTGTKNESALDIARNILSSHNGNLMNLYSIPYEELIRISGIGKIKGMQLKAIAELSKRMASQNYSTRMFMESSQTIADYYMEQMRHSQTEFVIAAYFDTKGRFLQDDIFSSGATDFAFFPRQEILKKAMLSGGKNIVVLHNHPSGDPSPSEDDIRTTNRLKQEAYLLDLVLVDHIIIGDQQFYSFYENQLI